MDLREELASLVVGEWEDAEKIAGLVDDILDLCQADTVRREREAALWGWQQFYLSETTLKDLATRRYPEGGK